METRSDRELTPPKTPKGNRTRALLKDAARKVFGRVGYVNARVTDITTDADLSNGSFYRYFVDKEQVLLELLQDLLTEIVQFARDPWDASDPLRSVRNTTKKYFSFYADNRDLYAILIEVAQHDDRVQDMWSEAQQLFYMRIARMLGRARDANILRSSVDPDLAAVLLGGMTEHYAYAWYVTGRTPVRDVDVVVDQLTNIWAHGVFAAQVAEATSQ